VSFVFVIHAYAATTSLPYLQERLSDMQAKLDAGPAKKVLSRWAAVSWQVHMNGTHALCHYIIAFVPSLGLPEKRRYLRLYIA